MKKSLLSTSDDGLVDEEVKPILYADATLRNKVDVRFERDDMQGVMIETKFDGGAWNYAGRYFISPATIRIKNGTGQPHWVEIRARYFRDMLPIGQHSDPVSVVMTP